MKSIIKKKKNNRIPLLLLIGVATGFVNGFLGAGGGIVIIFSLSALYHADKTDRSKDIFAMSVASILPISAVSAASYAMNPAIDFSKGFVFLIPALAGGLIGAFVTEKIKTSSLKTVFAVVTIIAGINMIFK